MNQSQENKQPIIAFVAGATGYTGRAVVQELVKNKVTTIAHIRPDSSQLAHWKKTFFQMGAQVDSTAWNVDEMAQTFEILKPTMIFCLLGTTKSRMKKEKEASYETIDYGLTILLLEAALKAKIKPCFVYLSSLGVKSDAFTEYLKVRYRVEQKLIQSRLPYIIARPSIITGPNRDVIRPLETLSGIVLDSCIDIMALTGLKKVRDRYHSTTNELLARKLVSLALDPKSQYHIYESEDLRN